ncbi:hypothetical protein [Hymenobacter cellulosilyticus]|nr:hypothetical protein [Hymenobacter cellulosilyticus]
MSKVRAFVQTDVSKHQDYVIYDAPPAAGSATPPIKPAPQA